MLNKHKLQRIAIATSALVAFGTTQLIANAETVTITGAIQGSTCSLSSSVGGGEIKSYTLGLGNVPLSTATSSPVAGTTFGTQTNLSFSLVAPGGGGACSFTNGTAGWDLSIAPAKSGFISTINGSTFLSNMVSLAEGGTDAVVRLFGGTTATPTNAITLTEAGSFVSSPTNPFQAKAASAITLGAIFAQPVANQKPNSGIFNSVLNLAIDYR